MPPVIAVRELRSKYECFSLLGQVEETLRILKFFQQESSCFTWVRQSLYTKT